MTTESITSITDGQRKQYFRFGEDALERALTEAGLDKEGIQKLIGNGGQFQADMVASIKRLSVSNQFADEEKESTHGYLSGYKPDPSLDENLADLETELARLRQIPELASADYDRDYAERIRTGEITLPVGNERWTLIPKWELLSKTYGVAVERPLALISQDRDGNFHNYREGKLGASYLRQGARSVEMWKQLAKDQKGDILIVPIQAGIVHRGRSVRRAREVFRAHEFGLGAFAVGMFILTHPERLKHLDDLWIDCAGDEYSPNADGDFPYAPLFYFLDGQVEFSANWVGNAYSSYGSASGSVVVSQ